MPVFNNTSQLQKTIERLFNLVGEDPEAIKVIENSKLILRLKITSPAMEVNINGRKSPPEVSYGSNSLKPDLEVETSADSLHYILLGEMPVGKAWSGGKLKAHGAITKSFVLATIFHSGQRFYPQVLKEMAIK